LEFVYEKILKIFKKTDFYNQDLQGEKRLLGGELALRRMDVRTLKLACEWAVTFFTGAECTEGVRKSAFRAFGSSFRAIYHTVNSCKLF
jgi:hypothetical protein